MATYPLATNVADNQAGHAALHNEEREAINDLNTRATITSGRQLYGAGKPEGAATANPGSYYTDTVNTVGVRRWFKATGTGNTGWVVDQGDTGVRDISSLIRADGGWTGGTLTVRRVNAQVFIQGTGLARPDNYTGSRDIILSSDVPGFFPKQADYFRPVRDTAVLGYWNDSALTLTDPKTGGITFSASGATLYAWPATLPGTAL